MKRLSDLDFAKFRQCRAIFWGKILQLIGKLHREGRQQVDFARIAGFTQGAISKKWVRQTRSHNQRPLGIAKDFHIPGRLILSHPIRHTGCRKCVPSPGVYHSHMPYSDLVHRQCRRQWRRRHRD